MDKAKIAELLVPQRFREWLTGPVDVPMRVNDPAFCPLACYLRNFIQGLRVYPSGIYSAYDDDEYDIPEWVENFIYEVDNLSIAGHMITKEQAIAVLDDVTKNVNMLTEQHPDSCQCHQCLFDDAIRDAGIL